MKPLFFIACLFCLFAKATAQPNGKMLIVSDIHFNPFADPSIVNQLVNTDYKGWQKIFESKGDTSYGSYGIDSYYRLFKSSLQAMKLQNKQPNMIVLNGDLLSHDFQGVYQQTTGIYSQDSFQSFVRKTVSFVFLMVENYFPDAPLLPVLGNNDDYCGDYYIQPSGPFLSFYALLAEPALHKVQHPDFINTFSKGGYYAVTMPWDNSQVFIGLNTVFMSAKYQNKCNPSDTSNPALEELNWLSATLATCAAQKKKVWLSYHILPGIDVFSSLYKKDPCQVGPVTLWKPAYNDQFIALVNKYSNIIKAQFAGHIHMDDHRLLGTDSSVASFVHITPAVSPVYQNNPAFEEASWDVSKMELKNVVTYRFGGIGTPGNNTWKAEYDFDKTYGITAINTTSLFKVWQRLDTDTSLQNKYQTYFYVTHPGQKPLPWKAYWCGMRHQTAAGFIKCNCGK